MMRISREEEHYIGRARPGMHGRVKVGFAQGRPHHRARHVRRSATTARTSAGRLPRSAGDIVSLLLSAAGDAVARRLGADQHAAAGAQRAAGRHAGHRADGADARQGGAQARHRSGGDPPDQRAGRQGAVRSGRTPRGQRALRRPARSSRKRSTRAPSCSTGTSGRRAAASAAASKVRGIGVAISAFVAGSIGFDGLFVIKPDGRMYDPVGHRQPRHRLGDRRASRRRRDARRAVGEVRRRPGATRRRTCRGPASRAAARRRTRMTRAAHAAATDAIKKLQEIAAKTHGGKPEAYKVANERVSGPRRQHDARAGGAEGDRARRQVRRPRAAGGHQRVHQDVGDGARRPGADGRRAGQLPARRRSRSPSSPASPKSKSTSRPASTTSSTTSRSPTSAR